MSDALFNGTRSKPMAAPPSPSDILGWWDHMGPENYHAEGEVIDAVNAALITGQPLLVTGEPGSGKTLLASRVSWELGLGREALKFETKSTSTARDVFYFHDTLGRFHDAQVGAARDSAADYITYNALGIALLRANARERVKHLLGADFHHDGPKRSVVLIDEIDKAPRDFPNDMLNEIENMYFTIPELQNAKVSAKPEFKPIVVITSNEERALPDTFLRRCVYFHLAFPEPEAMERIVIKRLGDLEGVLREHTGSGEGFLKDGVGLFYELRRPETGLRKKPGTAELLMWLGAVRRTSHAPNPFADDRQALLATLGILAKTEEDFDICRSLLLSWNS